MDFVFTFYLSSKLVKDKSGLVDNIVRKQKITENFFSDISSYSNQSSIIMCYIKAILGLLYDQWKILGSSIWPLMRNFNCQSITYGKELYLKKSSKYNSFQTAKKNHQF